MNQIRMQRLTVLTAVGIQIKMLWGGGQGVNAWTIHYLTLHPLSYADTLILPYWAFSALYGNIPTAAVYAFSSLQC